MSVEKLEKWLLGGIVVAFLLKQFTGVAGAAELPITQAPVAPTITAVPTLPSAVTAPVEIIEEIVEEPVQAPTPTLPAQPAPAKEEEKAIIPTLPPAPIVADTSMYAAFETALYNIINRNYEYKPVVKIVEEVPEAPAVAPAVVEEDLAKKIASLLSRVSIRFGSPSFGGLLSSYERFVRNVAVPLFEDWAGPMFIELVKSVDIKEVAMMYARFLPTPLAIAAWAAYAVDTYEEFAQAKRVSKRIEGEVKRVEGVNTAIQTLVSNVERSKLMTPQPWQLLGYVAVNRVNSALVPLVEIHNSNLNDSTYVTVDMLPLFISAGYEVVNTVGFISTVAFPGSTELMLMYNFELLEFAVGNVDTTISKEMQAMGYTSVMSLGYASLAPQKGFKTETL